MSSISDSYSLSSPSSGSDRSGEDGSSQSTSSERGQLGGEGTNPMESTTEVREDPPEDLAESNWPVKAGYEWVVGDMQTQYSLFWWSLLLRSWLNCIPIFDCVSHDQEGDTEEFFYVYMCHFSQLYIRLPFDDFTMGVLRLQNVALTQLHPNSWAYLQAFRVLCKALYLQPSLHFFLPMSPTT